MTRQFFTAEYLGNSLSHMQRCDFTFHTADTLFSPWYLKHVGPKAQSCVLTYFKMQFYFWLFLPGHVLTISVLTQVLLKCILSRWKLFSVKFTATTTTTPKQTLQKLETNKCLQAADRLINASGTFFTCTSHLCQVTISYNWRAVLSVGLILSVWSPLLSKLSRAAQTASQSAISAQGKWHLCY